MITKNGEIVKSRNRMKKQFSSRGNHNSLNKVNWIQRIQSSWSQKIRRSYWLLNSLFKKMHLRLEKSCGPRSGAMRGGLPLWVRRSNAWSWGMNINMKFISSATTQGPNLLQSSCSTSKKHLLNVPWLPKHELVLKKQSLRLPGAMLPNSLKVNSKKEFIRKSQS